VQFGCLRSLSLELRLYVVVYNVASAADSLRALSNLRALQLFLSANGAAELSAAVALVKAGAAILTQLELHCSRWDSSLPEKHDALLEAAAGCPQLASLFLSESTFTEDGVAALAADAPALRCLTLDVSHSSDKDDLVPSGVPGQQTLWLLQHLPARVAVRAHALRLQRWIVDALSAPVKAKGKQKPPKAETKAKPGSIAALSEPERRRALELLQSGRLTVFGLRRAQAEAQKALRALKRVRLVEAEEL
jgi:hypothetical protein